MTDLALWRPHRELMNLRHDIDELFDRFFGTERSWLVGARRGDLVPAIETFTRDDQLVVRADLPGVDPSAVDIAVEGNRLTIRGERKWSSEGVRPERSYSEVVYGTFERTLTLPQGVDPDTVQASYKDGVLEITMKAPAGLIARKVPVTVH